MITDEQPDVIRPPCVVESPCLAAAFPLILTEDEPLLILSGGPVQTHMLPTVAAGKPPIKTVGTPGGMIGPPVCGVLRGEGFVKGQE